MPASSRIVYPTRPRPRRRFPLRLFVILLGPPIALAVAFGFWYVLNRQALRVRTVEVSGVRQIPAAEIEAAVRAVIDGSILGLIPRDSVLLVSAETVEHALRERFPAIEAVNVGRRLPNRLTVAVGERSLWGIYCADPAAGAAARACALLDRRGTAYEVLVDARGWLLPVVFGTVPPKPGEPAVTPRLLELFAAADLALGAIGADAIAVAVASSTPADVRIRLAEGWELFVEAERRPDEWLEILSALLEREVGARRRELQYVDLRFGAKVFYKFK